MTKSIEDFQRLIERLESTKEHISRLEGSMSELLSQIQQHFGCSTLEEAEAKLLEMSEQEKTLASKLEKMEADFLAEWGDKLDE